MLFMTIAAMYCRDADCAQKKSVIPRIAATKLSLVKQSPVLNEMKGSVSTAQSIASQINCKAGRYLPAGLSSCSPCKDRYYCPGGMFSVKSVDQGLKMCVRSIPNPAKTACTVSCKAGQYLPANLSDCQPCRDRYYCPGGVFTTGTNASDQGLKICINNKVPNDLKTACITKTEPTYTCDAGQYLPSSATSCSKCKDRYYVCAGGTFNKLPVAQGILRCDKGQIADSTKTQCIYETFNCPAGQYLPAKTENCKQCKKDYYCAGGSYTYANVDQGYFQCKPGFHPNNEQTGCEKDAPTEVTCGAGFYLPANTMECKRCSNSKSYCPGGKTFKKDSVDQGIYECPAPSVPNYDKDACIATLSKTFLQFGPNETAELSDQCWTVKDGAKYKICLFGNKIVLPESTENSDK